MKKYILSIDQGTTSSRAILFDRNESVIGIAQKEFTQYFPSPGHVEHNPLEIWESQLQVMRDVLHSSGVKPEEIDSIGITNQRETTVVWERSTGRPVYNAIVWQDRRTSSICEELKTAGLDEYIRETTGLVNDAYFSGTKIAWILRNVDGAMSAAQKGELLFGTIDSWLIWNLTEGKVHATDASNASRTMLYDIRNGCWDKKLTQVLGIPESMLPEVKNSSDNYGSTQLLGNETDIPVTGVAGDQQSALFGQGCVTSGKAKNTYGTGCFMLMNTGSELVKSSHGLLTTIAWRLNGESCYALEGSLFIAGAAIQWLRDGLGIIHSADESEELALSVADTEGVYVVPAFAGLGAPYWDMYARGGIFGLTRGTSKAHLVRAALESLAYQTKDILEAMQEDSGIILTELRTDGGASKNAFLMQFQSDVLQVPVMRAVMSETTALGAARFAGLHTGFFTSEILHKTASFRTYIPKLDRTKVVSIYDGWLNAVSRCKSSSV